jgi:hypothetical protein
MKAETVSKLASGERTIYEKIDAANKMAAAVILAIEDDKVTYPSGEMRGSGGNIISSLESIRRFNELVGIICYGEIILWSSNAEVAKRYECTVYLDGCVTVVDPAQRYLPEIKYSAEEVLEAVEGQVSCCKAFLFLLDQTF